MLFTVSKENLCIALNQMSNPHQDIYQSGRLLGLMRREEPSKWVNVLFFDPCPPQVPQSDSLFNYLVLRRGSLSAERNDLELELLKLVPTLLSATNLASISFSKFRASFRNESQDSVSIVTENVAISTSTQKRRGGEVNGGSYRSRNLMQFSYRFSQLSH